MAEKKQKTHCWFFYVSGFKHVYAIRLIVMYRGVSQSMELSSQARTDKLWNVTHKTSKTLMFYQSRRKKVMFLDYIA